MPLKKKDRDAIKVAVATKVAPKFARDTLTLQLASKRVVLTSANGRKTAAGNLYERETAQQLPRSLDSAPVPIRIGNSEYLTLRGKKRRLRTWNAGENTFQYTTWGIKYYQTRRVEAVVSVPVIITVGIGDAWAICPSTKSTVGPWERSWFELPHRSTSR